MVKSCKQQQHLRRTCKKMQKRDSVESVGHITADLRQAVAETAYMLEQDWSDFERADTPSSRQEPAEGDGDDDDVCSIASELRQLVNVQDSIREELAEAEDCYWQHPERYSFGDDNDNSFAGDGVHSWWLSLKVPDDGSSIATSLTHDVSIDHFEDTSASTNAPVAKSSRSEVDFQEFDKPNTMHSLTTSRIHREDDDPSCQDHRQVTLKYSFRSHQRSDDPSTYWARTLDSATGMDDRRMALALASGLLALQFSTHVQRRYFVASSCGALLWSTLRQKLQSSTAGDLSPDCIRWLALPVIGSHVVVETISVSGAERQQQIFLLSDWIGRSLRHDPTLGEINDIDELL